MTALTICDIEERAAIMAEGNGWGQGRAERHMAYERGYSTWHDLVRAVKAGKVDREEKPGPM